MDDDASLYTYKVNIKVWIWYDKTVRICKKNNYRKEMFNNMCITGVLHIYYRCINYICNILAQYTCIRYASHMQYTCGTFPSQRCVHMDVNDIKFYIIINN